MHRALVRLPAFAIKAIGAVKRASARPRLSHAVAAARQRRSLAPPASADAPDRRRPGFQCPACNQKCHRLPVLESHLLRCCPDLVPAGAGVPDWAARHADEGRLAELLASIQERELAQRELALDIAFRLRAPDGTPLRQGPPEIAATLGVTLERAERLLRFAMRAVPLAADVGPLEVLYEDNDLLAVNKPPGMITAPRHRYVGGSMVNRVKGTLGWEPLVLHRLDMDTTGVLIFGKTRDAVAHIHRQFREKTVTKEYLALVAGVPAEQHFLVDAPIGRLETHEMARCVSPDGKAAVTSFSVVAAAPHADLAAGVASTCAAEGLLSGLRGASLVRCAPQQGRTHQIRIHLAAAGHPILGDSLYGLEGPWIARQALHAWALTLEHPRSGAELALRAPLPADLAHAAAALGMPQQGLDALGDPVTRIERSRL